MSANPLKKSQRWVHLPLLLLALGFGFPLLWLVSASLQPREQVAAVPPELLPRRFLLTLPHEKIFVTPPQRAGEGSAVVVKEWQLSKYGQAAPRTFTIDEARI